MGAEIDPGSIDTQSKSAAKIRMLHLNRTDRHDIVVQSGINDLAPLDPHIRLTETRYA